LQAVQETEVKWNGETVELTLNLVLAGRYEVLRMPMTVGKAQELLVQLQRALDRAAH
jgi:hypothetical protein